MSTKLLFFNFSPRSITNLTFSFEFVQGHLGNKQITETEHFQFGRTFMLGLKHFFLEITKGNDIFPLKLTRISEGMRFSKYFCLSYQQQSISISDESTLKFPLLLLRFRIIIHNSAAPEKNTTSRKRITLKLIMMSMSNPDVNRCVV